MSQGKSHKIFAIFVFILLTLICAYLFLHSSFFAIDKIYVTGSNNVSEGEIIKISGLSQGVNIFTINEKLCSQAVAIHPLIKSSIVVRHLPRQVEIQVKERKIWALVPYQGALLCVDDEGICIDKLSHFSLVDYPVITMDKMPDHVNLGQAVNETGVKLARQIWIALDANERKEISQFHYQNKSKEVLIYTRKGTEFRWGKAERLEEKTTFFKQMLKIESDMQAKGNDDLEYVDLRFKGQPVVKTMME
ncbi:MAG: FtsQ-type POTRA domain-containing protein, partial [Syntrophomonadaceae bacterium]|nr:FtsQ-type POTRA domain-containing protein [Syntrophomonadaceae bacterium]MDD4563108.1 FtsQ-type POTRA domain-containing protein [Syntrophomonadaceae bacterium]